MAPQNADATGKIDRGHQPADAVFDEGEWPSRRPPHNAAGGSAGGEDDGARGGRAREKWRAGIRASLIMVGARRMRRRWRLSLLATVIARHKPTPITSKLGPWILLPRETGRRRDGTRIGREVAQKMEKRKCAYRYIYLFICI